MKSDCAAVILGGGRGTRLFPLTQERAKPAVPFGGKFRLIDVPISNCLNSEYNAIFVLTQFNSASLHRHVSRTYRFDDFRRGFVHILAAEQSYGSLDWYQGTADAVRQNLPRLMATMGESVLILSGDQLYRMDFSDMAAQHTRTGADITIAVLPVGMDRVGEFGILKLDSKNRVVDFAEKPTDPSVIEDLVLSKTELKSHQLPAVGVTHMASMGIYVFKKTVLLDMLADKQRTDFGGQVIPAAIRSKKVCAYVFKGYWEDIGTIRSFFHANLELTHTVPRFDLYDEDARIYTRSRYLPGSKINDCRVRRALLCEGSIVDEASLEEVVVGIRTIIRQGTRVTRSILMGADYYKDPRENSGEIECSVPIGIGENCTIENAIIDKNVRIGRECCIANSSGVREADGENYYIRDGIVIIPRGAVVPDGTAV